MAASTNVNFYENQQKLQDRLHSREGERIQLEQQLNAYLRSEQRLSKLKAAKLQSYWKRLCDNEQRSQERNSVMLREFTRIENHMQTLSERTERLRQLKVQYMEEVEKKYPKWRSLIGSSSNIQQVSDLPKQDHIPLERLINVQTLGTRKDDLVSDNRINNVVLGNVGDFISYAERNNQNTSPRLNEPSTIQFIPATVECENGTEPVDASIDIIQPNPKPGLYFGETSLVEADLDNRKSSSAIKKTDDEKLSVSLRSVDFSPAVERRVNFVTNQENIDENVSETVLEAKNLSQRDGDSGDRVRKNHKTFIRNSDGSKTESGVSEAFVSSRGGRDLPIQESKSLEYDAVQTIKDVAAPCDQGQAEVLTSRDSRVYVNDATIDDYKQQRTALQTTTVTQTSMYGLADDVEEDDSDSCSDDIKLEDADYAEDVIPTAIEVHVTTINHPIKETSLAESTNETPVLKRTTSGSSLSPELTVEGLRWLLKFIQQDFGRASHVRNYYQSQLPNLDLRRDIIWNANGLLALGDIEPDAVSMVVLEQLTLVARNLTSGCILDDSIVKNYSTSAKTPDIRKQLPGQSQLLWDSLMEHFREMMRHRVMSAQEIAAVFVPGMVAEESPYQREAFSMLVGILQSRHNNSESDSDSSTPPPLPTSPIPALPVRRKPDDVPTLSLATTSTLRTDDDSEIVDASLTSDVGPKFSLTDTAAYKTMVSGKHAGSHPMPAIHDDNDTDDGNDDVEQQIHSILPNMSQHGTDRNITIPTRTVVPDMGNLVSPLDHKKDTTKRSDETVTAPIVKRHPAIRLDSESDVEQANFESSGQAANQDTDDIDFDFYE